MSCVYPYVDITDFTTEERKQWVYEMWEAADGQGLGIGSLYSFSNRDEAIREIEALFSSGVDYLNVQDIACKSIRVSFPKTGKARVLCSLYDRDNKPGLALTVTTKFRSAIGKPVKQ